MSCRKRPLDGAAEFDSAMSDVFQILMNISKEFLVKSSANAGRIDENEFEFAEFMCESLVSLGSSNLQCITHDSNTLSLYLLQVFLPVNLNTIILT